MGYLTGIERSRAEQMRDNLPTGMANRRIEPISGEVDADGMVSFRTATLSEQLDRIVAGWIWAQSVEGE